jgi:glycosyltransferase involved in cell wall biosynthesis
VTGSERARQEDKSRPTVSIVLATYNRPAVLAFAIRSVLAQDFTDWELIVVGDRCAEPTSALVDSFADARIRYVNLALNYGEQSGPDNVGIARARGRYIAFLNHDDCWFSDHLRAAMDWLEATGADVVIARSATIIRSEGKADDWHTFLTGEGHGGRYDPVDTNAPISTILLKSSVARAAGPLRAAADCFATSSQEWIFRIWKRGFDLRTMPHLTAVQFPSGERPQSYVGSDASEHAAFEPQFQRPFELRLALLDRLRTPLQRPPWRRLAKSVAVVGLRAAAHLGWCPNELIGRIFLRFRRGTFISNLRKIRGLPAMPEREPSIASMRAQYAEDAAKRKLD